MLIFKEKSLIFRSFNSSKDWIKDFLHFYLYLLSVVNWGGVHGATVIVIRSSLGIRV